MLRNKMRKWADKKLLNLIYDNIQSQKNILHEMKIIPKTTYRYECLRLGFRWYAFRIEILRALLSEQMNKMFQNELNAS